MICSLKAGLAVFCDNGREFQMSHVQTPPKSEHTRTYTIRKCLSGELILKISLYISD